MPDAGSGQIDIWSSVAKMTLCLLTLRLSEIHLAEDRKNQAADQDYVDQNEQGNEEPMPIRQATRIFSHRCYLVF
jgi:hypothetical protein